MFTAINTLHNNKRYTALNVFLDMSLQQTKNNRWIAPTEDILEYGNLKQNSEIELIWVDEQIIILNKGEENETSYTRSSYFRNKYNNTGVVLRKTNKLHKQVQNFIQNYILQEDNDFNLIISEKHRNRKKEAFYYTKLKDLPLILSTINPEVTVSSNDNKKRADILIELEKPSEIYGKGICIEIQLSSQNKDETQLRTYKRALLGLSTIWITTKDFNTLDNQCIVLKENTFEIHPYLNVLLENTEKLKDEIRLEYETQGRLVDRKLFEVESFFNEKKKELIKLISEKNTMAGTLCPLCEIGMLEIKKPSQYNKIKNKFMGCTNFPKCKFTANLE